jgi:trimethylamine--corrinoid protein Co-methyltransferase
MPGFAERFRVRKPRPILRNEDKKMIHDAALTVMQKVGVRVHSETARKALRAAGAEVDENASVVKFPRDMTESLIAKVPPTIVLAGREKEFDLPVDGTHCYFTTDGCGITVWNQKTQSRRLSVLQDITDTAIIADYLQYCSIYEPMVVASDIPQNLHVIKGMREAFGISRKHIESESTSNPEEARLQIEMASEIVGGIEALRKRHIMSAMVCTMSPLTLDGNATEAAMVWSEAHVPVHITGMAQMGISGPATIAGELVVNHAETLALAAAMQAHSPGSPVIYGSVLSNMDPRTGAYLGGSPEAILLGATSHEMAKFVNMPSACGGMGSSSRIPGVHATLENSLFCLLGSTVNAEINNGLGLVDGSMMLSYEQLMLDNEIAGMAVSCCRDITVTRETLHLDLIESAGILGMGARKGSYLGLKETMVEARQFYLSTLFNAEPYEQWEAKGKKDDMTIAKEKADWVLKNHKPVLLEKDAAKRLDAIVKKAAKD